MGGKRADMHAVRSTHNTPGTHCTHAASNRSVCRGAVLFVQSWAAPYGWRLITFRACREMHEMEGKRADTWHALEGSTHRCAVDRCRLGNEQRAEMKHRPLTRFFGATVHCCGHYLSSFINSVVVVPINWWCVPHVAPACEMQQRRLREGHSTQRIRARK